MFVNALKLRHYIAIIKNNPWMLAANENVFNYLKYKLRKKNVDIDVRRQGVVFLTLYLTRRCNLSCDFCIVSTQRDGKNLMKYEMSVDQCEILMNRPLFKKSLYVMLSGGEPLLNDDIGRIIRLLKHQKRIVAINTNGALLQKKIDELIESRIDSINISVYDENVAALRRIVPFVAKNIFTKLCKVVTKDMLDDPEKVYEAASLACESKCGGLYLANVLPGPGTNSDLTAKVIFDDDPSYEIFKRRMKKKFPHLYVNYFAPLQRNPIMKTCEMPWYFCVVDNQGDCGFCCYDSLCDKGNVFDEQQGGIYSRAPWPQVRGMLLDESNSARSSSFCKNCYLLNDGWSSRM